MGVSWGLIASVGVGVLVVVGVSGCFVASVGGPGVEVEVDAGKGVRPGDCVGVSVEGVGEGVQEASVIANTRAVTVILTMTFTCFFLSA